MRLVGKRAFVTGSSSGIGNAIAKRFLEEGAMVVGCGRRNASTINHVNYLYISQDISFYNNAVQAIQSAISKMGGLDTVVNAAGIMAEGDLVHTTDSDFFKVLQVNVGGVFNVCKAASKYLCTEKNGSIINISSDLGVRPISGRIAYSPSKSAVIMLTKCIALELAPYVRANTILPGLVYTPMIQHRFENSKDPESLRREMEDIYPLKRIGSVDDISSAAVYLASDESSFVTGTELAVCGGSLI